MRGRILVVDDEPANLRLMSALLCPLGHEVLVAHDGRETLERALNDPPDLILLDIFMPGTNGIEVARRLKEEAATAMVPVVMVTAVGDVETRVEALRAGADDFLTKPVDRVELEARVTSLLKVKAYNDYMRDYQAVLERLVSKRTVELREALEGLKHASLETVYRLSRVAEVRDAGTGAHIQRISQYAGAVARKLGLDGVTVEHMLYATPMHDIGKIGIPDRILLKRGRLSPDEREVMKQHTLIGAQILAGSRSEFIQLGADIALTHHERWDGGGYPRGLTGTEIPMGGRITAVVDVFDAMISERPYKEASSVEESLKVIQGARGRHFDPEVTDAFLGIADEIVTISARHQHEAEAAPVSMNVVCRDVPAC